jgi:hypothetical protein
MNSEPEPLGTTRAGTVQRASGARKSWSRMPVAACGRMRHCRVGGRRV